MDFEYIGKSLPRFDGPAKVSGETKFLADITEEGQWIGGVDRSNTAYGKLKGIIKSSLFDWSKVCVVTAEDIPGENFIAMVRSDYPALATNTVNYVSQAVALVAAPDEDTLAEAMAAIEPDIEPFTPVLTITDSLAKKAVIWGEDNVIDEYHTECGDVEKGFAEADVIVTGNWRTGLHMQLYLETQGMRAVLREDGVLEVMGSMQCPFYVHNAVSRALGLPCGKIVVKQSATGGAFGGKEDYPSVLGVYAALLAYKSGKNVRIIYGRSEDILVTPKRHPSQSNYKMGLTKDGRITALEAELLLDAGAYTTLSRVILQRAHLHACGCYFIPNANIKSRAMATNTPPTGAFRGFGAPQAIYGMERTMDKAAKELGMNPLDLRLKNTLKTGDKFPYGQTMKEANNAEACLLKAAELGDYRVKYEKYLNQPKKRVRKGMGIALALHGGGFTGAGEDNMGTTAKVSFHNGKFHIYTSATEMGQGAENVLTAVAAEVLGAPIGAVTYEAPDTSKTPNSGPTVASRTTMYIGKAVQNAAEELKKIILGWAGEKGRAKDAGITALAEEYLKEHKTLDAVGRNIFGGGPAWDEESFRGEAYRGYAWIACAAEVEVEMDTYEANAVRVFAAAEVGRAINPMQATGQLSGGILQSIGWAHIEDLRVDDKGVYTAAHMSSYLVPTTLDSPKWDIALLEDPCADGCFGAKGIGELPADVGAPAFAAALDNATGVFSAEIPLTGEKLFKLLEDEKDGGN